MVSMRKHSIIAAGSVVARVRARGFATHLAWLHRCAFLLILSLLWLSSCAWATDSPAAAASASSALDAAPSGAPVEVWNRTIITLYASFHGMQSDERAKAASARINGVLDKITPEELSTTWVESGNEKGVLVRAGSLVLFGVLPGDAESSDRAVIEKSANQAVDALRAVLRERQQATQPRLLLVGLIYSVVATVLLLVLGWLVIRLHRFTKRRLITITQARLKLDIAGFDLRPVIWTLLRRLVALVHLLLMLFLGYLWLSFVLRQFPYTRPWGTQLGEYLVDIALRMATGLVDQLPNLLTLVVIYLITRAVVRLIGSWFQAVEGGSVAVGWLDATTANVTRRLVSILIWLFALIVAYPYIPGAGTDAFKGVSVFLGLMLSLGSAGIVNQVMSGLVVLYSRAVRKGDFVHVGDYEGTVRELGALSMKLVTRTREEVSVPNSVLSSTPMRNLTRQANDTGMLLTTSVTIGYDTPWRQVVALLELAASRTPGLLQDPRPFVLQTALSDYYIEYLLNVATLYPAVHKQTESDLNRNIVDAFNEFGVQIMSPHFRRQPDQNILVPSEHWYDAPATAPASPPASPGSPSGPTPPVT